MNYILIGVQGSGKGTQANILIDNHGFTTFNTGQVLREHVEKGTEIGKEAEYIMTNGGLVDDNIIGRIITDFLEKDESGKVLFDGIPRNKIQKDMFDKLIPNYKVIFFNLPESEARSRLLGRMYNPATGDTFMSGVTHDPETGDILERRKDDTESAIEKRIDAFFNETMPIVEEYRDEGLVIDINANQKIEEVAKELEEKLGLNK